MTAWHELVVEGAERTLRAFVSGFLAGCGEHTGGVFGGDVALAGGSFGERGGELGLVVERRRVVESTNFSFRAEVFRAMWQRRFAPRCSPRCPPVCALSSDRKRSKRIPRCTVPGYSRRCTSTFTAYRETSSVHSREFWKCGSARERSNSWKPVRSVWKEKSSPRSHRASLALLGGLE